MSTAIPHTLSPRQRRLVVAAAFLGWLFAGTQMALLPLTARPAVQELLAGTHGTTITEKVLGQWFAWQTCAFLLGGAFGGLLFGRLGDRAGRTQALAMSMVSYTILSALCGLVRSPEQLLLARFLLGLGIGGTWPNGVALVSEAWPDASRPTLAGIMGAGANVGILLIGLLGRSLEITMDTWRTAMLLGAAPAVAGLWVFVGVPESPRWLAQVRQDRSASAATPVAEVFGPEFLGRTLLGIILGTIPLLGGWGAGKWLVPWTDAVSSDPTLKADTQAVWAFGAVLGSAAGGWLANQLGRRTTYFLISVGSLYLNFVIFHYFTPGHVVFLPLAFLLGLVATVYFGWLPLYLPELFPTRVRATGSGVAFNFGRFASAAGVLGAGELMRLFDGDYARVGATTALVYGVGMVVILFAPDTRSVQD